MEYTISKLAKLAGVSTRTLRYYDEIDLLKPARINHSGYRIYGQKELDRLQQILFFRELEVGLDTIIKIMNDAQFDPLHALSQHYEALVQKRSRLDQLIQTVEKTIGYQKGEMTMSDKEKFDAFKDHLVSKNEEQYGKEIREKYGNETVEASNAKLRGMSQEQYNRMEKLGNEILELLSKAVETGNPQSDLAQEIAAKHKEWLSFSWSSYSKEAHKGLADLYVADDRFKAYYDNAVPGGAEFLRNAIHNYVNQQ